MTSCIVFSIFSKTLRFFSFHIVHHIAAGTILLLFLFLVVLLLLPNYVMLLWFSQAWTKICWDFGIISSVDFVTLQCINRWTIVDAIFPQIKHLKHKGIPFFTKLYCVSTASLANNQTKQTTLCGILAFHMCFQGIGVSAGLVGLSSYRPHLF